MFNLIPSNRRVFGTENLVDKFLKDDLFFSTSADIRVDIKDNGNEYLVEADIPGISKEQIQIDYNNNYLTISVESREEYKEEKETYICRERKIGKTSRSFYVENVEEDKIEAHYKNGVLKVSLPKSKDIKKKNRIEIK